MSNSIRIKRRASGSSGAPSSLKNGELAFNEVDDILYYGKGTSGGGDTAATIVAIGGEGNFAETSDIPTNADFVDLTTAQNVAGVKTLTSLLNANGGIAVVGSGSQGIAVSNSGVTVFSVAGNDGDVVTAGSVTAANLGLTGGGKINGHTIPGGTGTFALTTDALATTSGHNYITLSGQDIVQGNVALGTHTSGNYVATVAGASGASGITITGAAGEGTATTVAVDSTVIRTTGGQSIAGTTTLSTLSVSNNATVTGDLLVSTDFEAASTVTFSALANKGSTASKFLVSDSGDVKFRTGADVLSDIGGAPAAGSTSITTLGTIAAGTWAATDVAVAHGGTGASTAAAARTNLVVDAAGTDNSTNVTLAGQNYLSLSGQEITAGVVALTTHTSGSYVASLVAGTGVTITGNVGAEGATPTIAIGQPVATTDDVTFDNITTTGYLRGPADFTIDPAAHGDATGTLTVEGNLVVNGSTTTVSSTTIEIADKDLQLAKNTGLAQLTGAGLLLGQGSGGAEVSFIFEYNSGSNQQMVLSTGLKANGGLKNTVLTSCTIDGGTF